MATTANSTITMVAPGAWTSNRQKCDGPGRSPAPAIVVSGGGSLRGGNRGEDLAVPVGDLRPGDDEGADEVAPVAHVATWKRMSMLRVHQVLWASQEGSSAASSRSLRSRSELTATA